MNNQDELAPTGVSETALVMAASCLVYIVRDLYVAGWDVSTVSDESIQALMTAVVMYFVRKRIKAKNKARRQLVGSGLNGPG